MNLHRRSAACLLLLALASCSSDNTSAPPPVEHDLSDVIYVGEVTDEALTYLLAATPKNDPQKVVIMDSPELSMPLPKDSPATFQFRLASPLTRAPGRQLIPARTPASSWRRPLHELLQFLAPERIAHAHGEPYSGPAYYLVITDADSKQRLQVFTPETSFTPEAVDWQNLVQAPQPLKLEITSAFFGENRVTLDGGPFVGGIFPFRIE
jgi:hypothetical protein